MLLKTGVISEDHESLNMNISKWSFFYEILRRDLLLVTKLAPKMAGAKSINAKYYVRIKN